MGTMTQLRREPERPGLTWEECRAIQMKRLDRHPGSSIIYWNLGRRLLRNVAIAEADGYFAKSIELERPFMEKLQASEDKEGRHCLIVRASSRHQGSLRQACMPGPEVGAKAP